MITVLNWDDIVREEKRRLRSIGKDPSDCRIVWNDEGWQVFLRFRPNAKDGEKYLGIKHYHNVQK